MNRRIADDERKSIGQLEAALAEGARSPQAMIAQGGLMNQLQSHSGLDAFGGLAAPPAEQIPGAQPQVFGNEQPEAHEIAGDFVGQQLAEVAL
jgi:hypothetical protein